jgi:hypothetical protein
MLKLTAEMIRGHEDRVRLRLVSGKPCHITVFHPTAYEEILERARHASGQGDIEMIFPKL